MKIRPYKPEDATEVRSLYERTEKSFPLPDLDAPLIVRKFVVKAEEKMLAVGIIKLTSEAILLIDTEMFKVVQAKVVNELIQTAVMECQKLGIDEIHAFLTGASGPALQHLLKEKHGFEDCIGIPMVLRI